MNCFIKEAKNESQEKKVCTPTKETKTLIYSEVKIHLTPSKKQKEMVEGCYSDKSDKPVKQNKKAIEKHSEAMDDDINQDYIQHSVKKFN